MHCNHQAKLKSCIILILNGKYNNLKQHCVADNAHMVFLIRNCGRLFLLTWVGWKALK